MGYCCAHSWEVTRHSRPSLTSWIDEIHERNRFCDFLLIALRDSLAKFRSLTLVLMSATMDTQVFTKYFNSSPVISVPGRLFDVEEYFLEDILNITGYMSKAMQIAKKELKSKKDQSSKLEMWTKAGIHGVHSE
ncbi:unnamed protein product, partial [Timema podura]|nr:unnamed protein product [Timema podura]